MQDGLSRFFVRIVLPYAAFAALWIFLSDRFLAASVNDPAVLTEIQTYKGLAFILVTSVLLYLLLRRHISLHDRAQEEQGRLSSQLSVLMENMSDGFCTLDNDWRFTQVDRRAAEMLRQKPEDLIGRYAWTELPQTIDRTTYHACERAQAGQVPVVVEDYYPPWNRWYEIRIHPSDEGLAMFFRDITERKRLEEKLQQDEASLAVAQTRARLGIWELDLATLTGKWSAEMFSLFGIDPAQGPPPLAKFLEMVHPDDRAPLMETHRQAALTGKTHTVEFRSSPGRGPVRHFRSNLDPMKDTRGRVILIAGTLLDISEHKQVEAALREREQDLEAIVENLPLIIFAKDAQQLRYVRLNRACEAFMGLPRAQILGKNDYDFFPPEQAEFFSTKDRETLSRNETLDIPEEPINTPQGQRLMHTRKVVVREPDGRPRYLLGISEDITERRLIEDALAEKQRLLSESQQIAHIGSWSWDLATDAISWSEETYRLYGVSPHNFTLNPDSFLNLIHPEDRAAMRAWINGCGAGDSPGDLEFRVVPPTGEIRVLHGRGVLHRDAENRPVRMAGTAQDITERKRVEKALKERDALLNETGRIAQVGGWEFDPHTRKGTWTKEVARIHDMDPEAETSEEIGLSFYHGAHRQTIERAVREAVELGNPYDLELEMISAKGIHKWVRTIGHPIKEGDRVVKIRGSFQDITQRKYADEVLHENSRQLQILSRRVIEAQETERRRLARELHDELGQALTAIKINLQSRDRFKGESPATIDAENIQLVENALQQVRRLALALRPSMLDDLGLGPALRWMADQQAERGGFAVQFGAKLPEARVAPEIESACFRIAQEALTNIVRHAQAKRVAIELRHEDNTLVMTVQDDGRGFDVAEMRERTKAGIGVGMLGMQERAMLLGGQLALDSGPGRGTTLRARFPWRVAGETA